MLIFVKFPIARANSPERAGRYAAFSEAGQNRPFPGSLPRL